MAKGLKKSKENAIIEIYLNTRVQSAVLKKDTKMTLEQYLNLRNGTDVRGVAVDGIKGEPITLTKEAAQIIVAAFCRWLSAKTGKKKLLIAVGYDSRISAPSLCEGA